MFAFVCVLSSTPVTQSDAKLDSDDEKDEFFDATAKQQELDQDERVEGPGQILLDEQVEIQDLGSKGIPSLAKTSVTS